MSSSWPIPGAWGVRQYRVRDDGTALNTDAGWLAGVNTRANTLTPGATYRVRFSIMDWAEQSSGERWYQVRWRLTGALSAVAIASGSGKVRQALSGQYAHGDACSTQLLPGDQTRAFSDKGVALESGHTTNHFSPFNVVLPEYEIEAAFQLGADAVVGEVYEIDLWVYRFALVGWQRVPGIAAEVTRGVASVAPVAAFSGTPVTGTAPLEVQFTDASTNSPETWDWDFGDGSLHSYEANPLHTYVTSGSYTVALVATNAAGSDPETKVGYVVVSAAVVWIPGGEPPSGWQPPAEVPDALWRRGHIGLGAKAYVIEANTYQKRQMPPFTQRFATGTLEYGDLSYWQYASQDDWRGGEGEELFDISTGPHTGYLKSYGIRATEPETTLRLAAKPTRRKVMGQNRFMLLLGWEGTPIYIGSAVGAAVISRWDEDTETWSTEKSFSAGVYNATTHGYPTAAAYAPPYVVVGTSKGRLVHLNSNVMSTGLPVNIVTNGAYVRPVIQILPISALLYFTAHGGELSSPWSDIWAVRWPQGDYAANWAQIGLTKQVEQGPKGKAALPAANGVLMAWHQGAVWMVANTGARDRPDGATAVLAWSDGADVLGYKVFPGLICTGMASLGARLLLVGNYGRQAVVMTDAGVVMQRKRLAEEEAWDETKTEFGGAFVQHDHMLIGGTGTPRLWEIDGGFALTEAVFLAAGAYDRSVRVEDVVMAKGSYHLKVIDGENSTALWSCKETDRANTHGMLWGSEWDAGMREVPKLISSITVRTKKALANGNRVEIWSGSYLLGQMSSGNYQEFLLPATVGVVKLATLRVKLIGGATGDAPEVTSVAARYVPLGPSKHVWSFAIKAENAVRTLDGGAEFRNGLEIANDLWVLIDAQMPIRLRDIDGKEYTVMITDAVAKCPMPDKPVPEGRGPEYQCVVEMVEY